MRAKPTAQELKNYALWWAEADPCETSAALVARAYLDLIKANEEQEATPTRSDERPTRTLPVSKTVRTPSDAASFRNLVDEYNCRAYRRRIILDAVVFSVIITGLLLACVAVMS